MLEAGNCLNCSYWQFEPNATFQNQDEQDGFGICDRVAQMMSNPNRALARIDEEFAKFQTRQEFGCILFEAK